MENKKITVTELRQIVSESIIRTLNEQEKQQTKMIVESIILSENVLDKVRDLARKGVLTAAIVASLMASQNVSAAEKAEIKNLASSEQMMTTSFPKEIKVDGLSVNSSSVDKGTARFDAIGKLKQMAKSQVYNKYKIDPKKYDVKITNIGLTADKTTQNPNGTEYNSTVGGDFVLTIVPRK
jgi:hypothetical protein